MIEIIQAALLLTVGVLGLGLLVWVQRARAQAVRPTPAWREPHRAAAHAEAHERDLYPQPQVEAQF